MRTSLSHPLTRLPQGATLRIVNGEERVIAVFQGQVWITQDNDPRDFFLGAGESLALDRPGLTVVQAFEDTRLMVLEAKPKSTLARTAKRLASRWRTSPLATARNAMPARS
jgi:hypothetical protein